MVVTTSRKSNEEINENKDSLRVIKFYITAAFLVEKVAFSYDFLLGPCIYYKILLSIMEAMETSGTIFFTSVIFGGY